MLFLKKNLKEELKEKIKKLDIEKIINDDVVKENIQLLNGKVSGPEPGEVFKLINNEYKSNTVELYNAIEKKVNSLIDDEAIKSINQTLEAYNSKCTVENEITELNNKIKSTKKSDSIDRYKVMDLEDQIEEKQELLYEIDKVFKERYKIALRNTLIKSDLAEMMKQLREIEDEEREQLSKEIQFQQTKLNALKLLRIRIIDNAENLIDKRINIPVALMSDKAIESSNKQIPLIRILLNQGRR